MKTAEEYYAHLDIEPMSKDEIIKVIEQVQKEAYNQALEDACLLGKVSYELRQSGYNPIYEYRIDKQSILRLRK